MIETKLGRIAILGVPVDDLSMQQAVERIDSLIEQGGFHQVATANVDFLMNSMKDQELMDILHRCEIVLADGMPLVWASRIMGTPLTQRITGADLMPHLVELSQRKKRRMFLLGASEERSRAAADWIEKTYPGAQLAGRYSPPFGPIEGLDHDHIIGLIEQSDADILLVAFGNPKQEKWLAMHRGRLRVPVCIGVGASIDFMSGQHPRAPGWMQHAGLEWLHRFIIEPRRLGRRYARNAFGVLLYLSQQVFAISMQSRSSAPFTLSVTEIAGAKADAWLLEITGELTGAALEEFQDVLRRSVVGDRPVVLDLTATTYVGADGLGILLDLSSRLRERGQELWLVGLRVGLQRLFRTAFIHRRLFRTAPTVSEALRRMDLKAHESGPQRILGGYFSEEASR
jgi:N-acetylglucosaminyldiphosphoundecaprenol N-acetyl-beta-D-mannosaminyltransferase